MDKQKRAYQSLIKGITQYIRDTVGKYSDKTYVGIVKDYDEVEDEYTVELNGVEYPHVSTIGGSCYINQTVYILIPQGNYSNMVILRA